jgi:hypothetical protein
MRKGCHRAGSAFTRPGLRAFGMKTSLCHRRVVFGLCRAFTLARPLQMQGCADASILARSQCFL